MSYEDYEVDAIRARIEQEARKNRITREALKAHKENNK